MLQGKTVGIIGAGDIVFAAHLPILQAAGARPSWILDVNEQAARTAAGAYGIPMVLSPDGLAGASDTDIVLVACPYGVRQPYYEALRCKRSVLYLEKPVAKSLAEQREIESMRPASDICAGFLRRSMGVTNVVRGLVASGVLGRLRHVRSEFGTATQISSGGGFAKQVSLAGGGQLFESAIHNIDAVCYLTGALDAKVVRREMVHEAGFDLHTEALIELTLPEQEAIGFDLLVTCFKSTTYEITLRFDHALVVFSLFRNMPPEIRPLGGGTTAFRVQDALAGDLPQQPYEVLHVFWRDFMEAVEARTPNYTNLCQTRLTTAVIAGLYGEA
ncbi:MAG: hypothetical protein RLY31_900 [Bacteroidota bacterium]|jgi:predicted dehydrogenase